MNRVWEMECPFKMQNYCLACGLSGGCAAIEIRSTRAEAQQHVVAMMYTSIIGKQDGH